MNLTELLAKYPPTIQVSIDGAMAFNDAAYVVATGDTVEDAHEQYAECLLMLEEPLVEPGKE